jgi:signal transduction histidine kinase
VEPERFPLIYHAQDVGTLLAAPRSPRESLNAADQLVLENVARQVSNIVHVSILAHDLQQSRQQILTTREEERRRFRRDLHDGLGPALATLTLQAEAAREWLSIDPDRSDKLLQEIISSSQNTLADIRRIVYDLRPPALDDLGLIPAIQEQAARYTKNGLSIVVEAPEQLPPLPAAVEVATYRMVQEALTNVAHHSQAHNCTVCLRLNGSMDIEIEDDGIGIPTTRRAGVGLNSIHEWAAELGGSCEIASEPSQGTQIMVSLPRE